MKLRLTLAAALTLAALFAAPAPAHGWNRTGHGVIAYIAYKRLTPNARKQVDLLLREHFRRYKVDYKFTAPPYPLSITNSLDLFVRASWWADEIRSDKNYKDAGKDENGCGYEDGRLDMRTHRAWHFIDLPFTDDGTPLPEPGEPNLLTVTRCLREALQNPTTPRSRKAYALAWLIHLVGDAHQPLHCTTRYSAKYRLGDSGGNLLQVVYSGQPMSLHTYWDALLGTAISSDYIKIKADLIAKRFKPEADENAGDLSVDDWVVKSNELARTYAYERMPASKVGFVIPSSYNSEAEIVASAQAALAGYRLAKLLNETFN